MMKIANPDARLVDIQERKKITIFGQKIKIITGLELA